MITDLEDTITDSLNIDQMADITGITDIIRDRFKEPLEIIKQVRVPSIIDYSPINVSRINEASTVKQQEEEIKFTLLNSCPVVPYAIDPAIQLRLILDPFQ